MAWTGAGAGMGGEDKDPRVIREIDLTGSGEGLPSMGGSRRQWV